jgi:hypothetical protein
VKHEHRVVIKSWLKVLFADLLWKKNIVRWLKSHGWKYYSLICYERKTLFVGWKSTAYKISKRGYSTKWPISKWYRRWY